MIVASCLIIGFTLPAQAKKASSAFGSTVQNSNITEAEVQAAQEAWGKALIQISKDGEKSNQKARETAIAVLDGAYGYNLGPVLFKPTLTFGDKTFRTTKEGALAYFVGGDPNFPNDTGFALRGWEKYEYKNAAVYINGDMALTMGNVMLTDKSGKVTTVDKTWGFKKDAQGKLRIVLHHSSLPFSPTK
ncbi:MAG: phosphoribosyl-AMP cyclohydrolase [Moraxellaceae bacterium]|nr:phosphoribosyl-AMP cyclohydrolase [Pseudobdellovibrionaceae bacterium]